MNASTEGYEAGRFSYLEVLDARRTTNAARIQYLQAITDYHKALQVVEALTADPRPRQPSLTRANETLRISSF